MIAERRCRIAVVGGEVDADRLFGADRCIDLAGGRHRCYDIVSHGRRVIERQAYAGRARQACAVDEDAVQRERAGFNMGGRIGHDDGTHPLPGPTIPQVRLGAVQPAGNAPSAL